jgi:hypothetical protein
MVQDDFGHGLSPILARFCLLQRARATPLPRTKLFSPIILALLLDPLAFVASGNWQRAKPFFADWAGFE